MTKLRNIGCLRFGSKIRQGFVVATPSLTARLSFFLLWMLFAANVGEGTSAFLLGGSLLPPAGRQAPTARWRGGRQPARPAGGAADSPPPI